MAARVPSKHNRDALPHQPANFEGILNDLQDWELSLKDKDKKFKAQSHEEKEVGSSSQSERTIVGDRISARKAPSADLSQSNSLQFDYLRKLKDIDRISSSFTEESSPNATSEKDRGNAYFKQKKFKEAIDCYSRSIALSPTAVAFANRAMAYLKIKRFEEAENDCTEALKLDDRYIKAYSRRATARKELGKLKESMEDSEFALRLEPQNEELKKQHAEAKTIYQKELFKKASGVMRNSSEGTQRVGANENRIKLPDEPLIDLKEVECTGSRSRSEELNGSQEAATLSSKIVRGVNKRELTMSVQELASRAASRATAEAEKSIVPPKSAYQFEISWKRLSGDRALQARLLKTISPSTMPQLFKNSLSASLLIDIVRCISSFFKEETKLAVDFLESLTKVSRFDMIIMCLFAVDKFELEKTWEEVFLNSEVPIEYVETLRKLHPKYCLRG